MFRGTGSRLQQFWTVLNQRPTAAWWPFGVPVRLVFLLVTIIFVAGCTDQECENFFNFLGGGDLGDLFGPGPYSYSGQSDGSSFQILSLSNGDAYGASAAPIDMTTGTRLVAAAVVPPSLVPSGGRLEKAISLPDPTLSALFAAAAPGVSVPGYLTGEVQVFDTQGGNGSLVASAGAFTTGANAGTGYALLTQGGGAAIAQGFARLGIPLSLSAVGAFTPITLAGQGSALELQGTSTSGPFGLLGAPTNIDLIVGVQGPVVYVVFETAAGGSGNLSLDVRLLATAVASNLAAAVAQLP